MTELFYCLNDKAGVLHSQGREGKAQCAQKSGAYIEYVSIFSGCCNTAIAFLAKQVSRIWSRRSLDKSYTHPSE